MKRDFSSAKALKVSTSIEQANKFIRDYMGDSLRDISIIRNGRLLYTKISYVDFKPERTVRRYIEDNIPNISIEQLDRDYSDEHIVAALFNAEMTMYVAEEDGCLRPTTPTNFICELMQDMDFTKIESPDSFQDEC